MLFGCLAEPVAPDPGGGGIEPGTPSVPGTVRDLATTRVTDSSVTLAFTEVTDGTGQPAKYDVRYAAGALSWGAARSVARGTCATPLTGVLVGAKRTCTVLGLASGTAHGFEIVAYRGTLNMNAVFGDLSNIVAATTAGSTAPVASVTVAPASLTLLVGGTRQLRATLRDARGNLLSDRTVSWRSSDPAVATVDATGRVTGVGVGAPTVAATSEGRSDSALINVVASLPPTTYYRTNFADATTGPLDVYAYGGGSCAASTDYHDPGSAYSIKCTIPAVSVGAAALQAWFGNGRLADLPSDPSLDQDVFQEVRFVLAPGAATAIGGTACTALNRVSQFKIHKSVYGQAGSAWNGWVMSAIGPCSERNLGLFTEAEMWNLDGRTYGWPGTFPSLNEGTVYDVIYRYHRYTAEGCGTIAIWVNDTQVLNSACRAYLGTTNGSTQGLLFWDGATYLQAGLGALAVYTLFTQATSYPIGAATASP